MSNVSLSQYVASYVEQESNPYDIYRLSPLDPPEPVGLRSIVRRIQRQLRSEGPVGGRMIAIAVGSSPDFVACNLACLLEEAISLPTPLEFHDAQLTHILKAADLCLVADPFVSKRLSRIAPTVSQLDVTTGEWVHRAQHSRASSDLRGRGVVKITHTSGTTSTPKGVLLSDRALGTIVQKLKQALSEKESIRALSLMPLSILVEEILAVYLPLISGGATYLATGREAAPELWTLQSAPFNLSYFPPRFLENLLSMADELVLRGQSPLMIVGDRPVTFATGGASVSHETLVALKNHGFDVREGYGLSENSSVVSWNTLKHGRIGSVGKVLPDVHVRISERGEILVKSDTLFDGYLEDGSEPSRVELTSLGEIATGDLGYLDDEGYLFITGRLKNVICLSNGRNVSPEWIESSLRQSAKGWEPVVFGDGLDFLKLVCLAEAAPEISALETTIQKTNDALPTYARIREYIVLERPQEKCFWTAMGKPIRPAIVSVAEESLLWRKI